MLDTLKSNLRYTNLHFAILKITNPNYIKWLKKELFFHKKFLNNENLIFDLGANLGDKTYIFSKLSICLGLSNIFIPGIIGIVIPSSRHLSTKSKYFLLSKNI